MPEDWYGWNSRWRTTQMWRAHTRWQGFDKFIVNVNVWCIVPNSHITDKDRLLIHIKRKRYTERRGNER